ncbi:MAG: ABC transporter permease [Candidatus Bipolaricaulota bacterium]
MLSYLARRSFSLVLTVLLVSVIVFVILQVIPGDPALLIVGPDAPPAKLEQAREALGLDRAPTTRYLQWLAGIGKGHLGESITYQVPVSELITSRIPVTLPLAGLAMTIALAISLPLGTLAASRRGGLLDWLITALAQLGLSAPGFWMGLLLIAGFAVHLSWFPSGGFPGWHKGLLQGLRSLVLPALALGIVKGAELTRIVRSTVLDTLNEQYVQVARGKGLPEVRVLFLHVLKNSLISVVTIMGLQFAKLLAGTLIIEQVFSLPGLGKLLLGAVWKRDFPLIQSTTLVISGFIILLNYSVDLLYGMLDPRIRFR